MTTAELLDLLRTKIEDKAIPYQFEDVDLLSALNHAQDEFARVTLCLFDGDSAVTAKAGTGWVTLPDRTVWIRAAQFGGTDLRVVRTQELEYGYFALNGVEAATRFSAWRNSSGTPKFLVSDLGPLIGRLVPAPEQANTLTLERYITPTHMTGSIDPEIPRAYHDNLVFGAASFLFGIPNSELYNPGREAVEMAKWSRYLTMASSALQTGLRAQGRAIPVPQGTYFVEPAVNTVVPNTNVNTES